MYNICKSFLEFDDKTKVFVQCLISDCLPGMLDEIVMLWCNACMEVTIEL